MGFDLPTLVKSFYGQFYNTVSLAAILYPFHSILKQIRMFFLVLMQSDALFRPSFRVFCENINSTFFNSSLFLPEFVQGFLDIVHKCCG